MMWYCLRRVLQEDDDALTRYRKAVLVNFSVACMVIALGGAARLTTYSVLMAPLMLSGAFLFSSLISRKRVDKGVVEVFLYLYAISVIVNDWYGAKTMTGRYWAAQFLALDIALVCRLPARVSYVLIIGVCTWLALSSTEEGYRWGLFDIEFKHDKGYQAECNCQDPPCAAGIMNTISSFVASAFVFLLDFYFTRGFAHGLQKEHEKMEAAINATERIASSLSNFDLTSAEAVLKTASLPEPLHDAFSRILSNLEMYRPYLPDALFAELCLSIASGSDSTIPGFDTGRAALVFTDIKGSTATWEACPDGMRDGLKVHDRVMRECIAIYGGYEVKTIGDAFMVAFENATSAVRFGLEVQESLVEAAWPDELLALEHCKRVEEGPWCGLRVRIGVHCGEVVVSLNPLTGRYDYFGNTVNKAARMEGACVGGAVAVTQEVLAEAGDRPMRVIDVGAVELKGVTGGVPTFMLLPERLVGRLEEVREAVKCRGKGGGKLSSQGRRSNVSCNSTNSDKTRRDRSYSMASDMMSPRHSLLQNKASGTCGAVEIVTGSDVDDMAHAMNSVLEKVIIGTERTHGAVVSLQGSRVAVSWNASKSCATHVENSLMFVTMIGDGATPNIPTEHILHIGLGTGRVVCGTVGSRRQRFITVLSVAMSVASKLCTDAVQNAALCYYGTPTEPTMDDIGFSLEKVGLHHIGNDEALLLYEISECDYTA